MKNIYLITIVFLLQATLYAQSKVVLGEEEIRKSPYAKFENRSDKFATPELKAIEAEIGKGLHNLVIQTDKPINYKGFTLQRFYSDEKGKFGGDILALNKNASYGHINSIKRILNAYIQSSFEYTEKNADVLVMEVLYYNAQNRNKLDRIKKRYTKSLVAALTKNKVGISRKFSEWPGNTQIVIPIKYSEDPNKIPGVSENKPKEEKKEETTTTTTGKNPVVEKEKIKQIKEKIPSSDIPKENITETKKKPDDKKNKTDGTVIKEEKKIIEKKVELVEKAKENTTDSKKTKTDEDPKTIEPKKAENSNKPQEDSKSSKESAKEAVKESKEPAKETAKEEPKTTKDSKDSKTVVINEAKSEPKKAANEDKPKEEKSNSNTTKDAKLVETVKEPTKDSKTANPTKEAAKESKEPAKETAKEEPKTTKDSKDSKTVVINEAKSEPKKAANEDKPKEEKSNSNTTKDAKLVETVKEPTKDSKTANPAKEAAKESKEPAKETAKEESKTTKDSKDAKTVAINEAKSEPKKAANEEKPVAKESKPVEPAKKVEEPKKEAPKTVVAPPAKKADEKLPTTKEEIKKMQKELTELKIKEKDKVENSENVVGEKIVFLKVKEFLAEGHYSSEMWAVDTENDDELFQSPFKKVCGKEFKELGTGVVVMSYKANDVLNSDTHHLALLDKDSLKLIKQTNEVIFWRSFLKEQNNKIYAVEFKDGKYYLAQFKDDLTFEMRSSDPINPDCEIAFKKNKIYLTKRSQDNNEVSIRVLNRDNLKLRDVKVMK